MPSPRLLVIEGNSPQTTADHVAVGGTAASLGITANSGPRLIPEVVAWRPISGQQERTWRTRYAAQLAVYGDTQ